MRQLGAFVLAVGILIGLTLVLWLVSLAYDALCRWTDRQKCEDVDSVNIGTEESWPCE